tara:strand:- start:1291 stop:1839 length:549 start_codon:yes stop_codon:yes gene_type:complete
MYIILPYKAKFIIVNSMASGQNHDKATKICCIPIAICIGLFFGLGHGMIAGISFLIGGLWLSPDLDTYSNSLKRWGFLKFLWWPYRKLIPHRSFFSHSPFIGTGFRLIYIVLLSLIIKRLIQSFGITLVPISIFNLRSLIETYRAQFITAILGIEGSAWLHLILDGAPNPIKWNKLKRKKKP